MFAKIIKEGSDVGSLLRFSFQMIWAGAITLVVATFFYCNDIMSFLYDDATFYWGNVLKYLMLSFIALSGIQIYGTLLTANGSLMKMNAIFIIGVFINVVLNYILIRDYKAEGAAVATVVTQFFVMIAQVFLVNQTFKLKPDFSIIIRIAVFIIAVIGVSWAITNRFVFRLED